MRGEADCLASDLDRFVDRFKKEYPGFLQEFRDAFSDLSRAVAILPDFESETRHSLPETLRHVHENRALLCQMTSAAEMFAVVISATPRLTTTLNRSRAAAISLLEDFVRDVRANEVALAEIETAVARILS
jgi:ABC-type transporter Mla subunit MlaD